MVCYFCPIFPDGEWVETWENELALSEPSCWSPALQQRSCCVSGNQSVQTLSKLWALQPSHMSINSKTNFLGLPQHLSTKTLLKTPHGLVWQMSLSVVVLSHDPHYSLEKDKFPLSVNLGLYQPLRIKAWALPWWKGFQAFFSKFSDFCFFELSAGWKQGETRIEKGWVEAGKMQVDSSTFLGCDNVFWDTWVNMPLEGTKLSKPCRESWVSAPDTANI